MTALSRQKQDGYIYQKRQQKCTNNQNALACRTHWWWLIDLGVPRNKIDGVPRNKIQCGLIYRKGKTLDL